MTRLVRRITAALALGVLGLALSIPAAFSSPTKQGLAPAGTPYSWYDGARTHTVWVSPDEIAVPGTGDAGLPNLTRVARKGRFSVLSGTSARDTNLWARDVRQRTGREAFGVVYTGPRSVRNLAVLTGDVIVHLPAAWTPEQVADWAAEQGLSSEAAFKFAPGFWRMHAGPGLSAVEAAERLSMGGDGIPAWPDTVRSRSLRAIPDDTLFGNQWHLQNTGQNSGTVGADINVVTAWDTNRGATATVAIVDNGVNISHEDLVAAVVPTLCFDYQDQDQDPTPPSTDDHGTECAGVAAARGFNSQGVAGSAPLASLSGIRLIYNSSTVDSEEADAETRFQADIDVRSNSWGPLDDGPRLEGPGPLMEQALANGTSSGRGGLGTVFCWAAGNGNNVGQNANEDGYANSRYVIAVAASTNQGVQASYSEKGANLLVNAPSSGGTLGVTTVAFANTSYDNAFGGTSASSPMVAGVVALMLDANPNLTWRDVIAILAGTAAKNDPTDPGWLTNGAGLHFNHKYGFGRVDATAAVNGARNWPGLGAETSTESAATVNQAIPDDSETGISSSIEITRNLRIEGVDVYFTAPHDYWPDLEVTLTSPDGTTSILAEQVPPPVRSTVGSYNNWRFSSRLHMGEESLGTWTLRVRDLDPVGTGTFQGWRLVVHGVDLTPNDDNNNGDGNSGGSSGSSSVASSGGGGGGGGGGCFIATAAYGSYLDSNVMALRGFRDRWLLTNGPGRLFVQTYYRVSPPLARVIAGNEVLRLATRVTLTPLVWTAAYPVPVLGLMLGAFTLLLARRRRLATSA